MQVQCENIFHVLWYSSCDAWFAPSLTTRSSCCSQWGQTPKWTQTCSQAENCQRRKASQHLTFLMYLYVGFCFLFFCRNIEHCMQLIYICVQQLMSILSAFYYFFHIYFIALVLVCPVSDTFFKSSQTLVQNNSVVLCKTLMHVTGIR